MMVLGLTDLYKQNKTYSSSSLPDSIKMAVKQYVADTDDIFGWFNAVFEKDPTGWITMKDIYSEYSVSEYFKALPKRQQRKTNAKTMKNDINESPNLKPDYRERHQYIGPNGDKQRARNVLIGWKHRAGKRPNRPVDMSRFTTS